jgi:hypothetical protein
MVNVEGVMLKKRLVGGEVISEEVINNLYRIVIRKSGACSWKRRNQLRR